MSAINLAHRMGEYAILDGRPYTSIDRYRKQETFPTIKHGFANGNAHVMLR
ncbi:hypothetical protein PX699_03015 [Sphingobium sp. H39-3-25]|nr:hypothetical protein [Sphingobium arseniciresistens]